MGKPIKSDEATTKRYKLDFSEVCVKISASEELKSGITVNVGREATFVVDTFGY